MDDNSQNPTIGEQVRAARKQRGWSQQRLAEEAGLIQSMVSMVETGERAPHLSTIQRIADALLVPLVVHPQPRLTGGVP